MFIPTLKTSIQTPSSQNLNILMNYVDANGYVCCGITGAMYDIPQAEYIANQDLIKHLVPHGYYP